MRWLPALVLVACGREPAPPPRAVPDTAAPQPVTLTLDTDPGLSDLALAPDGALWTVSERGRSAYRLVLDGDAVASIDRFELHNLADGLDVEAIAVIAEGRFALGTETHGAGAAAVWFASLADGALEARGGFDLPASLVGIEIADNKGVEGICADGATTIAAIETVIEERAGARFAPVIAQRTDVARDLVAPDVHRVRLTSANGKLAALHCTFGEQAIDVLAIERHYDVSRIVAFTLPRIGGTTVDATVVRDVTELGATRNFEGVVRLPDGRLALIVDNQSGTIKGPSELVLLP